MPTLYVRLVVDPANQELASTATPEPIHSSTDIIEIDESTTIYGNHLYIRLLIINNSHAAIVYTIQFIPRAKYQYKQFATWGQRRIHSGTVQRRLNNEIELGESFLHFKEN